MKLNIIIKLIMLILLLIMPFVEYIILSGDNSIKKFHTIDLDTFNFPDIDIPKNHMIIFSEINPEVEREILWNFFNRNKKILTQTRSLFFKQPMETSVAIRYLFEQLQKNNIKHYLSNLSLGSIFTIGERFIPSNSKNSSIALSKYFD